MPTTKKWLEDYDSARLGITLLVHGLKHIWTTIPVSEQTDTQISNTMFGGTDWEGAGVHRGLELIGERGEEVQPFDPTIRADYMDFKIVDHDDSAIGLFLREAHSTAKITEFHTNNADSDDTAWYVRDVSGFTNTQTLYSGIETSTPTGRVDAASPPDQFTGLTRGQYAVFGTNADETRWGVPHRIDTETGRSPWVSDQPLTHINRPVVCRIHHKEQTGWSSYSNAQIVFVGRIKEISDDNGRIVLHCADIRDMFHKVLFRQRFEGTLKEGMYFTAEQSGIQMTIRRHQTGGTITAWDTTATALGSTGALRSHSELASLISQQLATWQNAGTIPGSAAPGPATWGLNLATDDSGQKRYVAVANISAAATTDAWGIRLALHPDVWTMLGFYDPVDTFTDTNGRKQQYRHYSFVNSTTWKLRAGYQALKARLDSSSDALAPMTMTVENVRGTFNEQPSGSMPSFVPSRFDSGFLKVGDTTVPVNKLTATTYESARAENFNGALVELGLSPDKEESAGMLAWRFFDDGSGDPIRVSQVWVHAGKIGDIITKLVLSTGTSGYNYNAGGNNLDIFPEDMGVGIAASAVDIESFRSIGQDPYLLVLDKPRAFSDILESALAFKGYGPPVWRSGKITARPLGSEAPSGETSVSLTENNKARRDDKTTSSRSIENLFNQVKLEYQADTDGRFKRHLTINNLASQADFDTVKSVTVKALGIYEDLWFLPGNALGSWVQLALNITAYFGRPLALLERTFNASLVTKLIPGERVTITDDYVVDPKTGTRGITSLPCWVLSASFDWSTGIGVVKLLFLPEIRSRLGMWAPSARVNDAAANGGLDAGTNKVFTLLPREYSHSTQNSDVSRFDASDKIHIVEIGATAPTEWYRTVDTITASTTLAVVTAIATPAWDSAKKYVIEFDDALTVVQSQLDDYAFIADDADNSTGKATNDSYVWVGPATQVTSWLTDTVSTTRFFRKIPTAADDKGEPLSVHKIYDTHSFFNCALERNTAPLFLNEQFVSADQVTQVGTIRKLAYGPISIPLYGGTRAIKFRIYGSTSAGTATFRVITSTGPVSGSSETNTSGTTLRYPDGGTLFTEATTTSTTLAYTTEASIATPAITGGLPSYCYITVEISATAGNTATFAGISLREAGV